MKKEALMNILQSQLDYMVSRMDYPLDAKEIVKSLLSLTDGQSKILTVVDQRYFTKKTIKIIKLNNSFFIIYFLCIGNKNKTFIFYMIFLLFFCLV